MAPCAARRSPIVASPLLASPLLAALLATFVAACSKDRDASARGAPDGSAAAATSSEIAAAKLEAAAAAASAAVAKQAAANAAALERAKGILADIRWMVSKGVTVHPSKSGDGDLGTQCDTIAATRNPSASAELTAVLDEAKELCAFDVPLLTASEALERHGISPSQASRLLMCSVAEREIAKARQVHAADPRVRRLDARRIEACK